jgi:hypothetical protein
MKITNRQMGSLAETFSWLFVQRAADCGVCEVAEHVCTNSHVWELLDAHTQLFTFR